MRKREKRERKKQDRGIVDFMMVTNHFFHSLREWILEMDDPRLPICVQGDALYATEPMMRLCREYNWEYIFTQKDTRQKALGESFEWIKCGEDAIRKEGIGSEKGSVFYANHVEEVAGKTEVMNVYEYEYEAKDKKGNAKKIRFQWVTSLELNNKNIEEMVLAGRGRWKIENEGFNNQKNGLYRIEHLNSKNSNAMKNHYLLTQISDILMQLYLAWNPYIKELKQTIKNTSSGLLESFRRQPVTEEDVSYIFRYKTVYLE